MVFSTVSNLDDFSAYPLLIRKALTYLKETDFSELEPGKYEIDGDNIYALVQNNRTVPIKDKKPEIHKDYIDIQFIISGRECLGYAPLKAADQPEVSKPENDIYFMSSNLEDENFVIAGSGSFCIFYPYDIHRPGCIVDREEDVRKVVVKVKYSKMLN